MICSDIEIDKKSIQKRTREYTGCENTAIYRLNILVYAL